MNVTARSILLVAPLLLASCNGSGSGQKIVTNAMPLEVSTAFGTSGTVANMLYTTLTICDANSNCQTIDHIQVDTGSGGLRIFSQALTTVGLTQILSNGTPLAVCESFASGNAWGPVQTATVKLASEPAITIPVQMIDATFGAQSLPSPCNIGTWSSPMDIHANGILGIDVGRADSGVYFTCDANTCMESTSPSQRVTNPVLALPVDNNGVIINLPVIPDNGQATAYGELILGIDTTWNNDPKKYSAGNPIKTVKLDAFDPFFASTTAGTTGSTNKLSFSSFAVDSGSTAYFFSDSTIPFCSALSTAIGIGPYCPGNPKNFAVWVTGNDANLWNFQLWIRDATMLTATGNLAFNDLGANGGMPDFFIAGLPFFYGKQVYLGYATKSSTLGDGPLYGYALR